MQLLINTNYYLIEILYANTREKIPIPHKHPPQTYVQEIVDSVVYLIKEIISAMIAGTVIREVTLYSSMATRDDLGLNLCIMTWQPPTISMAMADERPPT